MNLVCVESAIFVLYRCSNQRYSEFFGGTIISIRVYSSFRAQVAGMEEIAADSKTCAGRSREEHNAVAAMTSPWIEKYRPETLKDLIAHQDIVDTGKISIAYGQLYAFLTTGAQ